jgi:hypothetical protein
MNAVLLRRIDPARNMRRFYSLDVQPDLFGGVLPNTRRLHVSNFGLAFPHNARASLSLSEPGRETSDEQFQAERRKVNSLLDAMQAYQCACRR